MRHRRLIRFVLFAAVGYLVLCCAAGVFITEATLHPGRRPLLKSDFIHAREMALRNNSQIDPVVIHASDGSLLQAWTIRPRQGNGDDVILLHGLSDNRMGMIGYAEMLVNRRFTILLPDARGHGDSGGAIATYGLLEADDIRLWLDWLREHQHPNCIFGFGESMGAAQLLQSLQTETRFCAVAAESPYSTFREIAYDRVGQFFRTGPWLGRTLLRLVVEIAFAYAHHHYKLNLEAVSPLKAVTSTQVPVFLIHGQQDGNIPVRHSRMIAAHNPTIAVWEVPGADHCGAISVAPQEFEKTLISWFVAHTGPKRALLPH
jgi:uncharacterized protein